MRTFVGYSTYPTYICQLSIKNRNTTINIDIVKHCLVRNPVHPVRRADLGRGTARPNLPIRQLVGELVGCVFSIGRGGENSKIRRRPSLLAKEQLRGVCFRPV